MVDDNSESKVSLLRPTASPSVVAQWRLTYDYHFSVPARQPIETYHEGNAWTLSPAVHQALQKALPHVHPSKLAESASIEPDGLADKGAGQSVCPPGSDGQEVAPFGHALNTGGGYGPQIFWEDFAIWFGPQCRVGRVNGGRINSFFREKDGETLTVTVLPAAGTQEQESTFQMQARRSLRGLVRLPE